MACNDCVIQGADLCNSIPGSYDIQTGCNSVIDLQTALDLFGTVVKPYELCGKFSMFNFTCRDQYTQEIALFMPQERDVDTAMDRSPMRKPIFSEKVMGDSSYDGERFFWGEEYDATFDTTLTADATGATWNVEDPTLFEIGGDVFIGGCSDADCEYTQHYTKITAIDDVAGTITVADALTDTVFAAQDIDGCNTCQAIVSVGPKRYDYCDEITSTDSSGTREDVSSYIVHFANLKCFNRKDLQKCYTCLPGDEGLVAGAESFVSDNIRDVKDRWNHNILMQLYFGQNEKDADGKQSTMGIFPMIAAAEQACGKCLQTSLCGLSQTAKLKKLVEILGSISECPIDNEPDVMIVGNRKALESMSYNQHYWNKLFGKIDACCGVRGEDKTFDLNYAIKPLFGQNFSFNHSTFLSKMFPHRSVMLLVPKEWIMLKTFGYDIDENMGLRWSPSDEYFKMTDLESHRTNKFKCDKCYKFEGSFSWIMAGLCSGRRQIIRDM